MNGNQEGCLQGILVRAFLARHEVISAIVLCIILGNKYQVQVMIIFENNKPNILFREHFNGMYGTDAFFYAKQVVDIQILFRYSNVEPHLLERQPEPDLCSSSRSSPLPSCCRPEAEKINVKKLEDNKESREPAQDEDGDTDDDEEDSRLYIPGGGLLDNLNTCDLRRLGQENDF